MRTGRRFSFFWISIFTIAGSGCAGCGDCFGGNDGCYFADNGGNSGCGNASFCDSETCNGSYAHGTAACGTETNECQLSCSPGYANCNDQIADGCETNTSTDPQHCGDCFSPCAGDCVRGACQPSNDIPIIDGLVSPAGLATDGVYVYYVDRGALTAFNPVSGASSFLAAGVLPNGGIITDGSYVYWGGQWLGGFDAGTTDAGDDSGDASDDDSGDDASVAIGSISSGIFRVNVNTGVVELVAPLVVYPGVALDLHGLGNVFARQQLAGDAGTSTLGFASPDSGAFTPLASLAGNSGNMHAIAPGAFDVAALDNSDIVSVALDGGGKSVVVADAGALSLIATTAGQLDVVQTDGSFTVQGIAPGSLSAGATPGIAGEVATSGTYAYVVNQTRGEIDQYSASELSLVPIAVATQISGTVSFVAADRNYVYWIAGSGVFQAPVPP
jgi:hypothetical protein